MTISDAPRAYSYLRFSTPEQSKGDSLRRQTAMATDYAFRHGLQLDTELTFEDLGVSAFRGQNADAGKLADFLEAVNAGLVPQGSYLLVEQLDRISRSAPRKALRVLEGIVDAGVSVVTMNDGRVYSSGSLDRDPWDLMVAIMTFIRANEESTTKSNRLKQSWANKRANLSNRPLTRRLPAWVRLSPETAQLELVPERAALVRRIFEMTLAGVGQHKIAETLVQEGVEPWGRGERWHRTYVAKILRNPAVVGTFIPQTLEYENNRKVRKALDPVESYFPPAVAHGLWLEVQALQAPQRAKSRGRHAGQPITNLLAGLASCPLCSGTVTRVNKGAKSLPSLVCAKAKAGAGCTYKSVKYALVEAAIVERLPARLRDAPAGGSNQALDDELWNLEAQMDVLRDRIETALNNLTHSASPALAGKLREMEYELDALKAERDVTLERRAVASGPLVAQRIERLLAALEGPLDRHATNQAMRSVFRRAIVNYPDGTIDLEWTHGGECSVPFMWPDVVAALR